VVEKQTSSTLMPPLLSALDLCQPQLLAECLFIYPQTYTALNVFEQS
jgi:hypothetical protein